MVTSFDTLPPIFKASPFSPASQPPKIYVLDANPTTTTGYAPYEAVLNKVSGDVSQLLPLNGVYGWTVVANIKGPAGLPGQSGDGVLDPIEQAAILAVLEENLDPPIDLSVLFENSLV